MGTWGKIIEKPAVIVYNKRNSELPWNGGMEVDTYQRINDVLVRLFNEIMDQEQKAIITEEFKDISNNDMHIVEAIGLEEPKNMSTVARSLSVTVGTLTIAINSLVKKGYVSRVRSEEDRRVVLLSLSDKGKRAYRHHEQFHKNMVEAVMENMTEEELPVLMKALESLSSFFRKF